MAPGDPPLVDGQILLQREFHQDGKVAAKPSLVALDGEKASAGRGDYEHVHYRVELTSYSTAGGVKAAVKRRAAAMAASEQ
jgi:hypothetical protein